jgi:hypothetical protein
MITSPLVVVVGHATSTSARILASFPAEAATHARIHWRAGGEQGTAADVELRPADPFASAVVELGGLPAGAEVEYAVTGAGGAAGDPGAAEAFAGTLRRFRTLPADRPLRLAFVSCNGVRPWEDEQFRLWERLGEEIARGEVDLVVHGGDQIYADALWGAYLARGRPPIDDARLRRITADYRDLYRVAWRHAPVARVLGSCPNLMAWDDHEIFDGYGSHGEDGGAAQQGFFAAARQAYAEFQVSHGPEPLHGGSFLRAVAHGQVGIVLLDTRSNRMWRKHTVLGDEQIQALKQWGDAHGAGLRRLYVVSSVPLLHAKVSGALELLKLIPGTEAAEDDLRDSWLASNNRGECGRLAKWLFSIQAAHPGLQVTVLSGDVHVASLAELRSKLPQHVAAAGPPRIFQVTSSGIGSEPPSGFLVKVLDLANRDAVALGTSDVEGRLLQINGSRGLYLRRRNFVVLNLEDDDPALGWNRHGNLRADYHVEEGDGCDVLTQVLNGPGA